MQCVTFGQHLHLNGSVVQQDAAASSDRALQLLVRDPNAVGGLVGAHRGVIGQSNLGMKKHRRIGVQEQDTGICKKKSIKEAYQSTCCPMKSSTSLVEPPKLPVLISGP